MDERNPERVPGQRSEHESLLEKHCKLTAFVAVAVAGAVMAGLLMTLYLPSSPKPSNTRNLSAFPRSLVQTEADLANYDFGVRMDVQVKDCSSDTHWKKTFPDLDYSLLGYDVLYGYPLANGRDPGFRHPIFRADYSKPNMTSDCRYIVPRGFTVIPSESCVVSFESKLVRSSQEMSQHLAVQAKVEGGGWGFEFSASASYNRDTSEISTGEFLYVMSDARCHNYYSMVDFTNPPPFHPGFLDWANRLSIPETTDEEVMAFIEYYGTHFFTDVTFGAKFVQKHKVSQTSYQSLKKNKISVEAQASYSGLISIGGGFSLDKEQSEAASNFSKAVETTTYTVGSTPPANGDAMTWASSVQNYPVPMLYSVSEIGNVFTGQFSKHLTPGVNYKAVRDRLSNVSLLYCKALQEKGAVHSCESKFHLEGANIDIKEKGYRYLREVDKPLCISFCLQDTDCAAVTYSVKTKPPRNSLCKFYSTKVPISFQLMQKDGSDGIVANLVLFFSNAPFTLLHYAKLNGTNYSGFFSKDCKSECERDLFCDAYSHFYRTNFCLLFSRKDIKGIVQNDSSDVGFYGLHKRTDKKEAPF